MKAWDWASTKQVKSEIARLQKLGWYHSIELPDGRVTPGIQSLATMRKRLRQFPLPDDLRGKRALDIGAWDGWFSFEMEKRGASVVAVDAVQSEKFLEARELLGSKVEFVLSDVYDLNPAQLGKFDVILFLGVLYHLKHPLLALEKVCALAEDLVCVESHVTDDKLKSGQKPCMEFYETTELGGQFDNWVGPNVAALLAFCRAAGFARSTLTSVIRRRAHVACFRKWDQQAGLGAPPHVVSAENSASHDQAFAGDKDEYLSIWFRSSQRKLTVSDVFPEIGPYGARPAVLVQAGDDGWQAVVKLPPGLSPGWHDLKIRVRDSAYSNIVRLGVGAPALEANEVGSDVTEGIAIESVADGRTWERFQVRMRPQATVSLWVRGLPAGCRPANVTVRMSGLHLACHFVSEPDPAGLRQINARLPAGLQGGKTSILIAVGTSVSEPVDIEILPAL